MSFRAPTLLTAGAMGLLLAAGSMNTAIAGGGYGAPHGHQGAYGYRGAYAMPDYYRYGMPRYGHMHGRMPHPVYGTLGAAAWHAKAYGKGGSCSQNQAMGSGHSPAYHQSGYMMKTGAGAYAKTSESKPADTGDIVDVAVGAGSFTTLVQAVQAAGLVETLKGDGPYTVFAPTDDAFAKIDEADLKALLADKDKLTAVLTYHVVPGKVMAADVVKLDTAKTVQGSSIDIDASDGVKVDNASVVQTDIVASNGVIHVIDTVIMPN